MQPYGFIYITTNLINGKRYIGQCSYGQTKNILSYLGSGKNLKLAFSKYGKYNFTKTVIFETWTPADLNWAECHFISEFNAVDDSTWYNIAPGGRASLGFTGKKHTPERNKKLSAKMMGHTVTDKVKENMRLLGKQKRNDAQTASSKKTGKIMGLMNKGKKASTNTKLKMRQSALNRPERTQDFNLKMARLKRKMWRLKLPNSDITIIDDLTSFCTINNTTYSSLYNTLKSKKPNKDGFLLLEKLT